MKLQEFYDNAKRDNDFYLGNQLNDNEKAYLLSEGREVIVNNKIRRNISAIDGYHRLNQLSCAAIPQNNKQYQEEADVSSDAIQYLYTTNNGYNHLADCFLYGSLISGINFSEIVCDYSYDSDIPDIKFIRVPYNGIIWDPYFTNTDLSDCSYITRRKILSKHNVLGLLPKHASEIKKMKRFDGDSMFTYMPQIINPNGQEQLAYTELWRQTTEKRSILIDVNTGMRIDLIKKGEEDRAEEIVSFDNNLKIVKRIIPTVKLDVFINDEYIETSDDPLGINDYPFVPFTGIYIPEHSDDAIRLQSILRIAIDPQRELNKRISKFLDILDTKTHVGWMFKKSALADGEDPYKAGNYRNIALKNDAVIGQDIQQITPPPTDPSLMESFNVFDNNIMQSMGLNDASFGNTQNGNESGLLQMLRQQSAALGLNGLFDNFYLSQRVHVKKSLQAMYKNWPNWKWKRITGREEIPVGFRDSSFIKYNIVLTQGVLTENQQKMYFAQLMELRQLGVASITDSMLVEEAPIQKRSDLMKKVQEIEQQQQQLQQQQFQLQQQQIQLANAKTMSEIEENKADSVRANARAIADVGLTSAHIAEATQSRAKAALDTIKASQEIIKEDTNQLTEAMAFVENITDQKLKQNYQSLLFDKGIIDFYANGKGNPEQMPQDVANQEQQTQQQQQSQQPQEVINANNI